MIFPISILVGASSLFTLNSSLIIFDLYVIGMGALYYDLFYSKINDYLDLFIANKNIFFLICVITSILFILYFSNDIRFNLLSLYTPILFFSFLLTLYYANFPKKYFIFLLPVFILTLTFATNGGIDLRHYSFMLGPVIEILYGHHHPFTVDIQYGGGLAFFLAFYFKLKGFISLYALHTLLKYLTFVQYLLVYTIAVTLYRSYKIAFLALVVILFFNFYSQGMKYYGYPSSGFLRFGFIYLILLCYLLEEKKIFSKKLSLFFLSLLGSISFIWSFESAMMTLPALFFAEYINKNLLAFLSVFLILFGIIIFLYLAPLLFTPHTIDWVRYIEYPMIYGEGFCRAPMNQSISFWWLLPSLYGFYLIRILLGIENRKIIVALVVYGTALFTYYIMRGHPNNIFHASIPFILLSIYLVIDIKFSSSLIKNILLASLLTSFFLPYYAFENTDKMILKKIFSSNFNLLIGKENLFSDLLPHAENCSDFASLKKYIKNNTIALLTEDLGFFHFYTCEKISNSFKMSIYDEVIINSNAKKRILSHLKPLSNQYILVDMDLLNKNLFNLNKIYGDHFPQQLLALLQAKKIGELKLKGRIFGIYAHV